MMRPRGGRAGLARWRPAIAGRVIAAAAVKFSGTETSGATAPNNHLRSAPHSGMRGSCNGSAHGRDCLPGISHWVVTATVVEVIAAVCPAPHNHAATGPHCAVIVTCRGRTVGIGWYPGVIRRIIASPVIQNRCSGLTAPDNHLRASPDRSMVLPRARGISSARGLPTIC